MMRYIFLRSCPAAAFFSLCACTNRWYKDRNSGDHHGAQHLHLARRALRRLWSTGWWPAGATARPATWCAPDCACSRSARPGSRRCVRRWPRRAQRSGATLRCRGVPGRQVARPGGVSGYALSPRARADLDGIWDYTAGRWGVHQADRYARQIVDACAEVAWQEATTRPSTMSVSAISAMRSARMLASELHPAMQDADHLHAAPAVPGMN